MHNNSKVLKFSATKINIKLWVTNILTTHKLYWETRVAMGLRTDSLLTKGTTITEKIQIKNYIYIYMQELHTVQRSLYCNFWNLVSVFPAHSSTYPRTTWNTVLWMAWVKCICNWSIAVWKKWSNIKSNSKIQLVICHHLLAIIFWHTSFSVLNTCKYILQSLLKYLTEILAILQYGHIKEFRHCK